MSEIIITKIGSSKRHKKVPERNFNLNRLIKFDQVSFNELYEKLSFTFYQSKKF